MSEGQSLLDRIRHLIELETFNLPVLSDVGFKLRALASNPDCDLRQVEPLIMRDQALTAEVLRTANSAFFGGLSETNTISKAVARIGLHELTKVVFMASERSKYQARDPLLRPIVQAIWRHATASAMAADWLTRRRSSAQHEEAFLGGLLHDIGELVLLRALDEFRSSEGSDVLLSAELVGEVLASAHNDLGFNFLKQRRIPEVYCGLARDHHKESFEPRDTLMAIIRLADLAAHKLGLGVPADSSLALANSPEAACLDADEIMLAELEVMLEDCMPSSV